MRPPANGSAASPGSFEDFEPFLKWQKDPEGHDTLVLQVPEFKREQMKLHVSNQGLLKISGERPLGSFKRKRFYKTFDIPKDCDTSRIRAKLTQSGDLHILMPKKTTAPSTDEDQATTPQVKALAEEEIVSQPKSQGTKAVWVLRVPRWDWKVVAAAAAAAVVIVVVAAALGSYAAHKFRSPAVGPSHASYSSDL